MGVPVPFPIPPGPTGPVTAAVVCDASQRIATNEGHSTLKLDLEKKSSANPLIPLL